MPQELFSVFDRFERFGLFAFTPGQRELDMCLAKIGRKVNFGDGDRADPRVGQLVANQLFQFLAETFRNTLVTMGVQISG